MMEKQPLKQLLNKSIGQVLLVLITVNILNLIIELLRLKVFENINIAFKHGYFILNGEQIGLNIFSNITTLIVAVCILMIYNYNKE